MTRPTNSCYLAAGLLLAFAVLVWLADASDKQRNRPPAGQPFFFQGQLVKLIGQEDNLDKLVIIRHGDYDPQARQYTYFVRCYGVLTRVWEHELRAASDTEKPLSTAKVR